MLKSLLVILSAVVLIAIISSAEIRYSPRELQEPSLPNPTFFSSNGFKGNWESLDPSSNPLFSDSQGKLHFKALNPNSQSLTYSLLLYKNLQESSDKFFLTAKNITALTNTITFDGSFTLIQNYEVNKDCRGTSNFNLSNEVISGEVYSEDCSFFFKITARELKMDDLQEPIVSYSFLISCISVALIFAYSKHAQDCLTSEATARKTSISFLLCQSGIDLFFSLWHLYLSTIYFHAFDYLILSSFMSFAVYMVIHGRLMLTIWRAQNPQYAQEGIEGVRRRYTIFESYNFILLTSFIPLVLIFREYIVILALLSHCYFLQIAATAKNGYKNTIKEGVIVVVSASRLLLLLYLFGCPANFRGTSVDGKACAGFVALFLVQVGIMIMQNRRPRFFLPKLCRPKVYSYFRELEEEKGQENSECIICMTALNLTGHENQEIVNFARTMHTPCRHMFHEDCLNNWMAVKMECPTCRSSLPLIEE